MDHISAFKARVLSFNYRGKFQSYFSEQYSIMGQLLRYWLSRLFYKDSGTGPDFIYTDENDYMKLIHEIEPQFGTFILEERETRNLIEDSIMGPSALEQQRHSEHSIINSGQPVQSSNHFTKGEPAPLAAESPNRVEDVGLPSKARRKPSKCSGCGVEGHTYNKCPQGMNK
jgi:hypothetical protein